jgi:outer membrane receptor protein involved in Fe transport
MKSETSYPASVTKRYLVACLAALVGASVSPLWAQTVTTKTADEEVVTLTAFEVESEKDYGYLKTNSATATRIGMEIQKIPLNISVISREFLDDTNAKSLTDLFRYSAAASGDTRFAMRIPANEATPQGSFTMRGFQVNTLMRNGVFRYIGHNLDNVERVEIVKGPASVFFGQGYPGGVINYVTKRPSFTKIPTTISVRLDDNSGQKVVLDTNTVLSKKAAMRIVGAWEDAQGERRFEYRKNFNLTPSLTLKPLDSGKLTINLEFEYQKSRYNQNDYDWIYSDFAGWKTASTAGTYGSSTAVYNTTIAANAGNLLTTLTGLPDQQANGSIIQNTTRPTLAYGTYIVNKRNSTGNLSLPSYTSVERGAYYTNKTGQFIQDEAFNYTARGAYNDDEDEVFVATVDMAPFEWLDARYVYTNDKAVNNSVGQGGAVQTPWANGVNWNVGLGNRSGYWRTTEVHNLDMVFKFDLFGVKNKILTGYQRSTWLQQYLGGSVNADVSLSWLPGARNTTSNPDYRGTNIGKYEIGQVPVNQVIYQRDGSIKPVRQIYANWDPGFEMAPDINQWFKGIDRNALDGYKPTLEGQYLNWQASALDDRLTVLAGMRKEKKWERGQWQVNNFPYYIYFDEMWLNPTAYPENVWGHSVNYQKTNVIDQEGDSWMAGASFAINKNLSVYASVSRIFKFNAGVVGGMFIGDEMQIAQGIIDEYAARRAASPAFTDYWVYNGTTITSAAQIKSIWETKGYYKLVPNEFGNNKEIGAKYSSDDNKIVATFSIFLADRINRREDDGTAQANAQEPINYNVNPVWIAGAARSGLVAPSAANTGRVFRVRTYGNKVEIKGAETEVIWTPIRNFQALINASWMPTAETTEDSRVTVYPKPGTSNYTALSAAAQLNSFILWNARVENVPEYRFNVFAKYTFTDGPARGVAIGAGLRYSSQTVVSRSVDWNPLNGGYQAGDYLVFDLTAAYPWEVMGYKIVSSFGLYNVTDEKYSEGSFALSPARNWLFTNTLRF